MSSKHKIAFGNCCDSGWPLSQSEPVKLRINTKSDFLILIQCLIQAQLYVHRSWLWPIFSPLPLPNGLHWKNIEKSIHLICNLLWWWFGFFVVVHRHKNSCHRIHTHSHPVIASPSPTVATVAGSQGRSHTRGCVAQYIHMYGIYSLGIGMAKKITD